MAKKKMYQRPDGLFEKKITIGDKRVTFRGKTEREVMQKVVAYSEKESAGPLFKDMAVEWWDYKKTRLSPNTMNGYSVAMRRSKERFGDIPVKEITTTSVRSWLDSLAHKGFARKTVCNHLLVITAIIAWACETHNVTENPATLVHIPDGLRKEKRTMPSNADIKVIQDNADTDDGFFFYFLLYTGLRLGEALALRWCDIDATKNIIHVSKSVYFAGTNDAGLKAPKTDAGTRDIIYLERLKLVAEPRRQSANFFVFGGDCLWTKKKYTALLARFRRERGISSTPHQLRHAFATLCFEAGVPEKTAQGLLGHAQLSTTMDIYAELRDKKKMEAAAALNFHDF